MFDPTVFLSTYVAFMAAFASMEAFSFLMRFIFSKRHKREETERVAVVEEIFEKAAEEGKMLTADDFPPGTFPPGFVFPTPSYSGDMPCSGGTFSDAEIPGQYL